MRIAKRILLVLILVWLGFAGFMYTRMASTPLEFAGTVAKLPQPALMTLPFPPMWKLARAGTLRPGDLAPDFDLPKMSDRSVKVRLSSFRGSKPVVLVFGSYT